MRVALDSNILAYLAGVSRSDADAEKIAAIRDVLQNLAAGVTLVAPVQALGELFVVLRKSGAAPEESRAVLLEFSEAFGDAPTSRRAALSAADLVVDHKLQFWDSLIVSAAIDAGCSILLSEDMQNGFVARGLTIVNPLAPRPHAKMRALLP